jgi:outer membrane protein assembly factor BamB
MIAAVNSRTGQLLEFQLSIADSGGVQVMARSGDVLYFAGQGLALPGQPGTPLGSLLSADAATGRLRSWTPALNLASVSKLIAVGKSIYAAGVLDTKPQDSQNVVVSFDAETGMANWTQDIDSTPWDMKVANDTVYISGSFHSIGGAPHENGLAALAAASGALLDWNPPITSGVGAIAIAGNTLYTGGNLTLTRHGAKTFTRLAAADLATAELTGFDPAPDGPVSQLAIAGNVLVMAGEFHRVGGRDRTSLAAIDLETGLVLDWNPNPNSVFIDPYSIAATDQAIYVAGRFTTIGG